MNAIGRDLDMLAQTRDGVDLSLRFANGAELELEWTGGFWTGEMTASGQGDKDTGHGLDAFWLWMNRAGRLVSFEPRRLSSMPFTARHRHGFSW